MTKSIRRRNLVLRLVALAALMCGFGYCVTGFKGPQTAEVVSANTRADAHRTVLIQFNSNLRDGLPWKFHAARTVEVHPGQLVRVSYDARNDSNRSISGRAVATYTPAVAAAYMRKLECFCTSIQTLAPHEVRRMPVVFMIDPSLPSDVPVVTLSYTFFEAPRRQGWWPRGLSGTIYKLPDLGDHDRSLAD
jgi:cytochrome c oxidase assembly protein subunit 11